MDEVLSRVTRSIIDGFKEPKDACRALCIIALLSPVSESVLSKFIGDNWRKVSTELYFKSLVEKTTSGNISMHPLLVDYFLDLYGVIETFSIRQLDFGAEAAEADNLLEKEFQPLPFATEVLGGKTNIIIGDRGTGKSALFRSLEVGAIAREELRPASNDNMKISVQLGEKGSCRSARYTFTALNGVSNEVMSVITAPVRDHSQFLEKRFGANESTKSADEYKAFWLLYFAIITAEQIINWLGSDCPKIYKKQAVKLLRSFGREGTIDKPGRIAQFVNWSMGKIGPTVKISVGPMQIDPEKLSTGKSIDVYEFLRNSATYLEEIGMRSVVIVDQIDEVYKYERVKQESLVQGLFLAEKYLTEEFHGNLGVAILLRSDLYALYDIQEKNKLSSRKEELVWTQTELLEFLIRRVFSNKCLSGISDLLSLKRFDDHTLNSTILRIVFPENLEGKEFSEWLFAGLRNSDEQVTPRQLLLFLLAARNLAREDSFEGFPIFNSSIVAGALTEVSRMSYDEMISDFRVAVNFVRSCKAGRLDVFDLDSVSELFGDEEGSISSQVESLERLGFLERIVLDDQVKGLSNTFRIPKLYTRAWGGMSDR